MSHLHIFDMDGTLLTGTTASTQIAKIVGTESELAELERAFAAAEIDTRAFSAGVFALWAGLTEAHVTEAFRAGPFLDGIDRVCADIRERGERSLVITMSPDFYAERLLEYGFDRVAASRFPVLPFSEPLDSRRILTPADKVRIVEETRSEWEIPADRCVAYGDSMSDAPLFRHLAHTVAVNADHHLEGIARAGYTGPSLLDAYASGRALIDPR
ncbi:phosphoserine phosphatase [Murinocardiopsis flavida]|uniref:Phosphoserine phosphatase n=1 Tax=Murinocardiopsis flavida TaxID=645275 RepID=A0A2P8DGJ2_9ACTN|nr:HAD-IB family phosphatase [Murinocardiopsis flavida]PSK96309.1 phosphoserine phosphatase [Murinocardiopsis flavida]